jgi:uncharacterized protein (TIGR01244 family)
MTIRTALAVPIVLVALAISVTAQSQVTKETVPGITNFARLQTTVACAGAVKAEAVPDIKKLGFASIINLREASEQGANIEAEAAAAKAANLNFVHLPFNIASPAPDLIDRFVAEVTKPANQPAFIHCAAGGRAAALWMIKRVQVDHWDQARATEEATALGLNDRLKTFAITYLDTHKR